MSEREISQISWTWVRGHNGHPENEACDFLAQRTASIAASLWWRAGSEGQHAPPQVGRFH